MMNTITILLAEDNEGHARLTQKNLARAGLSNPVVHVDNGQRALDFVHRRGEFSDREPVTGLLLLLDLNMPVLDGFEVLEQLKADATTCHIPVVVLTTTDAPHEIDRCYQLGCNVYLIKPVDYDHFCEAIRNLGLFLSVMQVPGEPL
ncbi:MAG: response regulator [Mariprofundales bacterium]|nr:response regulator [Mariprofundales bacterium]